MIYNSNRIMNNFIAESFYNEGNRMINNIFNSNTNIFNEAISFKGIKEKVVNFFRWLLDKIKQAGLYVYNSIKKIIDNFKNKKLNLNNVDKEENNIDKDDTKNDDEYIEIDTIDINKVKAIYDNLRTIEDGIDYLYFDNMDNPYENCIKRTNTIILNINTMNLDELNNNLDKLKTLLSFNDDSAHTEVYKILELFGLKQENISVAEAISRVKNKYSIFETDGSIKEEYKKSIKVRKTEATDIAEKIRGEALYISTQINSFIKYNCRVIHGKIIRVNPLVTTLSDAIDKLSAKINSIDGKVNTEAINSGKEVVENMMKQSNTIANIGNEINNIGANNAAKIIKNAEAICTEITSKVSKASNKDRLMDIATSDIKSEEDLAGYIDGLDRTKIQKLCRPDFSLKEFAMLRCVHIYNKKASRSFMAASIVPSYMSMLDRVIEKCNKILKSANRNETDRLFLLKEASDNKKIQEMFKNEYNEIFGKKSKNESYINYIQNAFNEINFI